MRDKLAKVILEVLEEDEMIQLTMPPELRKELSYRIAMKVRKGAEE